MTTKAVFLKEKKKLTRLLGLIEKAGTSLKELLAEEVSEASERDALLLRMQDALPATVNDLGIARNFAIELGGDTVGYELDVRYLELERLFKSPGPVFDYLYSGWRGKPDFREIAQKMVTVAIVSFANSPKGLKTCDIARAIKAQVDTKVKSYVHLIEALLNANLIRKKKVKREHLRLQKTYVATDRLYDLLVQKQ